jgi:hypothetical protein
MRKTIVTRRPSRTIWTGFSLKKFKPDSEMGMHGRLRDRVHGLYPHGSSYAMRLDFIVGRLMILAMAERGASSAMERNSPSAAVIKSWYFKELGYTHDSQNAARHRATPTGRKR